MDFTSEQLEAINAARPLICVSAGAGSGKTMILIERIARLLSEPARWPDGVPQLDKIVAITFTEKAAGEMKARLRRKFRELASRDTSTPSRFWQELERQVDSARITTIHAFCASLLREKALHAGLDPDWGVLNEAETAQLSERVITDTLRHLLEEKHPGALRLSVEYSRAALKQVLLDALRTPWTITDARYNNSYKSPDMLLDHWTSALPKARRHYLSTLAPLPETRSILEQLRAFEGACSDPNDKRELYRKACVHLFEALCGQAPDTDEKIQALSAARMRLAGSKKCWSEEDFEGVGEIIKAAGKFLKDKCSLPTMDDEFELLSAQLTCDFHAVAQETITAYAHARQERAVLDYEDMINETLRLLRQNDTLRTDIAGSIRFLLIDEFQDTDGRQMEIARLLAEHSNGPDLFVVGDAKQSIYHFRGAEVSLFNEIRRQDSNAVLLADNFRSLPDVLAFVNTFFSRSQLLSAVGDYDPMGHFRPSLNEPRVELYLPRAPDPDHKESAAERIEREARYVARRIHALCGDEAPLLLPADDSGAMRNATYNDVALLFRRGSNMYVYESAFREMDIPYTRVSGAGYFQRREIQDVLALLQLIFDPYDEEALVTFLRSPLAGLSDESLMRLAAHKGGLAAAFHSTFLPEFFDQEDLLDHARLLFEYLYAHRAATPSALVRLIYERTGYEAVLLSQHLGLQRASNLRKLVQIADDFARRRSASSADFTRYMNDVSVRELREGDAELQSQGRGAVTLMTIHKAKGLEFPVVFIPEMYASSRQQSTTSLVYHADVGLAVKAPDDQGDMHWCAAGETMKRLKKQAETFEMARILYVATTRARDYLVLCGYDTPNADTWADTLNKVFELTQYEHNDIISGTGWSAVIKRDMPPPPPAKPRTRTGQTLDISAISERLAPWTPIPREVTVLSVSRLLSLMGSGDGPADAFEPEQHEEMDENASRAIAERELAMARGNLVHRLFELWDFRKDAPPNLDMLLREARLGLERSALFRTQLLDIIATLRDSEHWPLFSRAQRVERETPFLLDIGPVMVRGVVDAVIDDNIIVDYKTGRPGSSLTPQYEWQLLLYAAALRGIRGHLPTTAMLWYADHGYAHTINVNENLMDDVLERARKVCRP